MFLIIFQITRDKNDLEELLRIFRESHDTFEFIEKLKNDLEIRKESAHLENLDLCHQWIKVIDLYKEKFFCVFNGPRNKFTCEICG